MNWFYLRHVGEAFHCFREAHSWLMSAVRNTLRDGLQNCVSAVVMDAKTALSSPPSSFLEVRRGINCQ